MNQKNNEKKFSAPSICDAKKDRLHLTCPDMANMCVVLRLLLLPLTLSMRTLAILSLASKIITNRRWPRMQEISSSFVVLASTTGFTPKLILFLFRCYDHL
jgi:hypothetical protein